MRKVKMASKNLIERYEDILSELEKILKKDEQ